MKFKDLPEICPICKRKKVFVDKITDSNTEAAFWFKAGDTWICAHCFASKKEVKQ